MPVVVSWPAAARLPINKTKLGKKENLNLYFKLHPCNCLTEVAIDKKILSDMNGKP